MLSQQLCSPQPPFLAQVLSQGELNPPGLPLSSSSGFCWNCHLSAGVGSHLLLLPSQTALGAGVGCR